MESTCTVSNVIDKLGAIKQFVFDYNGNEFKVEYNSKHLTLKTGESIEVTLTKESPESDPYSFDEADYAMSGHEIDNAPKGTRCISFGGLLTHFPNNALDCVNKMCGLKWYIYIRKCE